MFTKGPWKPFIYDGKKWMVQTERPRSCHQVCWFDDMGYGPKRTIKESRANANLIAAAPDMYSALEYVLDNLENDEQIANIDFANELYVIKQALAKARGEE